MMAGNPGEQAREGREAPSCEGRSILIIDDELDFAESLQDLLELVGCQAEVLTGATDLAEVPSAFEAEVVLLDVRLREASGIDLIAQLHARWPLARVIVVTGFASKETAIEALRSGAVGYLEKPLHQEELRATIEHALWAYDAEVTMRRTEAQLRESLSKVEAADRSKSLFLANMSHELRTPLNAIIGFSEIMKHEHLGPLTAERYMNYIDDIYESGRHILSIIDDVLDLSQLDLAARKLELQEFEMDLVVKEVFSMIRKAAREREVALKCDLPPVMPRLSADRRMVKQMLINLLGNAVKFTEAGGRVGVSASVGAQGELLLAVEDDGIGISADRQEEVFQPFGIAEPVESRSHGGAGLGLSITKQLIEHHGGWMKLQSESEVGTTVTLVFPAERVIAAPDEPGLPGEQPEEQPGEQGGRELSSGL